MLRTLLNLLKKTRVDEAYRFIKWTCPVSKAGKFTETGWRSIVAPFGANSLAALGKNWHMKIQEIWIACSSLAKRGWRNNPLLT